MTRPFSGRQFGGPAAILPGTMPDHAGSGIDPGRVLAAIWRGKWLIALFTALAVLAGGYYALALARPVYKATAVVMLETQPQNVVDLATVVGGLTGDTPEINSQVEVLKSRGLLGQVVDRLNLVQDGEFNPALRPASRLAQLRALAGLAPPATRPVSARQARDDAISALLAAVSVRNIPLSFVFQVTVETGQPGKSARIADTIAALYVQGQLDVKHQATEQATAWLAGRVGELQSELEQAEARVARFSATTDLVSAEALRAQEIQIKELRERIAGAATAAATAIARHDALMASDTTVATIFAGKDDPLGQHSAATSAVPRSNPGQEIARARMERDRVTGQLAALRRSEAEMTGQIERRGQDLITLQQLTREADAVRQLYEYFLARYKETSAQKGVQKPDSRILSGAVVPSRPSAPRKSLIVSMAGIFGCLLGLGLVLLRETRNQGFRSAGDLELHTGQRVLGQIPQMPARARRQVLQYLTERPSSEVSEAVRNLRTSLLQSGGTAAPRVILSTSSVAGEGKTTNSLALAQNLAGLGKSVLLIEGDVRRRTFRQHLGPLPDRGLVSVLSGDRTLESVICRPDRLGADVLVAEASAMNAADIFATDRFGPLIGELRNRYDAVIIDSPPVLVVPDARIIAPAADAVLFTVHWDRTSHSQVDEALRLFRNSGLQITGLVLSQINMRRLRQYGHGGIYGAADGARYYLN